jgi:hypothetical protein
MIVPPEMVPAVRGVTAFLSSQVRGGDWIVPRLFRAVSFWGDVKIDLTSARFGAGTSRIELMVIMGNVTVLVPPDVRVDCDGDAIIGSFDMDGQKWSTPGGRRSHGSRDRHRISGIGGRESREPRCAIVDRDAAHALEGAARRRVARGGARRATSPPAPARGP